MNLRNVTDFKDKVDPTSAFFMTTARRSKSTCTSGMSSNHPSLLLHPSHISSDQLGGGAGCWWVAFRQPATHCLVLVFKSNINTIKITKEMH